MNSQDWKSVYSWIDGHPYVRDDRLTPDGRFLYRHAQTHRLYAAAGSVAGSVRLELLPEDAPLLSLEDWLTRELAPS